MAGALLVPRVLCTIATIHSSLSSLELTPRPLGLSFVLPTLRSVPSPNFCMGGPRMQTEYTSLQELIHLLLPNNVDGVMRSVAIGRSNHCCWPGVRYCLKLLSLLPQGLSYLSPQLPSRCSRVVSCLRCCRRQRAAMATEGAMCGVNNREGGQCV